jgi:hypothetical protein
VVEDIVKRRYPFANKSLTVQFAEVQKKSKALHAQTVSTLSVSEAEQCCKKLELVSKVRKWFNN